MDGPTRLWEHAPPTSEEVDRGWRANVGGPNEAAMAMREGADGVGILRTEFGFLGRSEPPGEEEQYASDPLAIPVLLGLGVTSLSVRSNAVAAVKQVVRAVAIDEARALAEAALGAASATAVRDLASQHQGG